MLELLNVRKNREHTDRSGIGPFEAWCAWHRGQAVPLENRMGLPGSCDSQSKPCSELTAPFGPATIRPIRVLSRGKVYGIRTEPESVCRASSNQPENGYSRG
jgi:hypothetical protein